MKGRGKAFQEEGTSKVWPQPGLPEGQISPFSAGESQDNLLQLELRERSNNNKNGSSLLYSRPALSNRTFCDDGNVLYL